MNENAIENKQQKKCINFEHAQAYTNIVWNSCEREREKFKGHFMMSLWKYCVSITIQFVYECNAFRSRSTRTQLKRFIFIANLIRNQLAHKSQVTLHKKIEKTTTREKKTTNKYWNFPPQPMAVQSIHGRELHKFCNSFDSVTPLCLLFIGRTMLRSVVWQCKTKQNKGENATMKLWMMASSLNSTSHSIQTKRMQYLWIE